MKTVKKWTIATRTKSGGPWHLDFCRKLFTGYEPAARRAFELIDDPGYDYKPVQVTVAAVENLVAGDSSEVRFPSWRDRVQMFADIDAMEVAFQDDCECLDDHGTYVGIDAQLHCMGCAADVAVEPWDGLFVGEYTVFRAGPNGQYTTEWPDIRLGLSSQEVGLTQETLMGAVRGYVG